MKRTVYLLSKRLFDIICSVIGIIITSPIWLIAIIGIELSDYGPVFYIARRVGRHNKEFRMYKFRSMRIETNANEYGFKADVDRIFPFGWFMRNSKIDELPQLINILLGNMSIVGPRPASIDQVKTVRMGKYEISANVTSGLTGPSALYDYIYGDTIDNELEYKEKVLPTRLELDAWYVKHMTPWLDIKMILYTVVCVCTSILNKKQEKILNEIIEYIESEDDMV
ncbi:sugar transferase [Lachnoclostridium pacaense]|uniref:sugar transferase n=1 Tax=Enterocloster hominis (ex Hitch et al. 2024) TaxID=1917870 RepID=UPI001D123A8F|nr:sugar transferase [Lachnoclostridium pacaense]MCC2816881.1 sugar transferase [Lachnoclostridium pacaense]MCC2878082.1 sugar transferase [Lachnoclostridium pacaense]